MKNIIVAIIPGVIPIPKKTTDGIKYTNAGIVCMKSSIGVTTDCTVRFCDIQIPTGTPMIIAIITDIRTRDNVSIVSGQYSRLFISTKPININIPIFQHELHQENNTYILIIIYDDDNFMNCHQTV